ncbi:MAG: molybdate ABC transporter substrate-binding protein [Coriobacteriales bacterium]|jgi:molybdate transport system substrate-binding protein|nr:molybdate ABC transporter substrate-binding protein [Coriobacteriales bacterium]
MAFSLVFAMAACGSTPKPEEPTVPEVVDQPETPAPDPVELQIFAANSLEKGLPEVQELYTAQHPEVTFIETQFKGSGDLVEEMKAGGSADIFISASKSTMDTAVENGNIDEATRVDLFANDLVIVKAVGADITINSLEDVKNFDRIAIGEAGAVPAGAYANQSLFSIGLYTSDTGKDGEYDAAIASKVVQADKVGTAANWVATGDCQIGFVYSSDIYRYDGVEVAFVIPADSHKDIVYPGAVTADTKNAEVAADFLKFCQTDPDAQKIWSQYGFEVL